MIKDKRGLEMEVIVRYIYITVGFLIILLIAGNFAGDIFPKTLSIETCRGSVFLRGAALEKTALAELIIPSLKCKTEYRCLTKGEKCSPGYEKVPVKGESQVKKEIADAMYNCWFQLGEGSVDFIGKKFRRESSCVICSRIIFDEAVREEVKTIDDFRKYLADTKAPNGQSYLQYISNNPKVKVEGTDQIIDLSKEYAVVYSIYTGEYFLSLVAGALPGATTGAVIGSYVGPIGTIVGGTIGGISGILWVEDIKKGDPKEQLVYSIQLTEFTAENIAKSCSTIESLI